MTADTASTFRDLLRPTLLGFGVVASVAGLAVVFAANEWRLGWLLAVATAIVALLATLPAIFGVCRKPVAERLAPLMAVGMGRAAIVLAGAFILIKMLEAPKVPTLTFLLLFYATLLGTETWAAARSMKQAQVHPVS